MSKFKFNVLAIVLFIGFVLPSVALASHDDAIPTGIRIQVTNVNNMTGQVDFDVIVSSYASTTTTISSTYNSKDLTAAWIGDRFFYNWANPTTTTESNTEWVLVDPAGIKALDFGDGNVVDAALLAIETNVPRTYKGSFSHTYAMPGTYTITSKVVGVYLGDTTAPNYPVNYGNPITFVARNTGGGNPAANGTRTSKPKSHSYGFYAYRPTSGSSYISAGGGNMLGLSNTTQVTVSAQANLNAIPIPSLDDFSRLLMGLFIALAGGWILLHRR